MRTRKRGPHRVLVETRFIELPDAALVIVRDLDDHNMEFEGAFVKVQPTIRTSERSALDVKAIRQRYLDAGAAAVVVAPVVIPDAREARSASVESERQTSEQHLRAWFERVTAPRKVVERAIAEALASMSEAGL